MPSRSSPKVSLILGVDVMHFGYRRWDGAALSLCGRRYEFARKTDRIVEMSDGRIIR